MKQLMEFDLPEDQDEFEIFIKARDYDSAIVDMFNFLRSEWKYNDKLNDVEYAYLEKIRDKYHDILRNHNIEI